MSYKEILAILQPLQTSANVYQVHEACEILETVMKVHSLKQELKHTNTLKELLQHKQRLHAAMTALEQMIDKQKEKQQAE